MSKKTDFLLVTALTEEHQVLSSIMERVCTFVDKNDDHVAFYSYITQRKNKYTIAIVSSHAMGATKLGAFIAPVLRSLKPQAAALIGIAAAVDIAKVELGDVPFSAEVISYDDIVIDEDGAITFRTSGYQAHPTLKKSAAALRSSVRDYIAWQDSCRQALPHVMADVGRLRRAKIVPPQDIGVPHLLMEVTGGGPILLRDTSFRDSLRSGSEKNKAAPILAKHPVHPKLVSTEMESHGFMFACHEASIPGCVIKGISDDGDEKKADLEKTTGGFYRIFACVNATMVALHILEQHPWPPVSEINDNRTEGNNLDNRAEFPLRPEAPTDIIGYDKEESSLKTALREPGCVVVSGLPGIGKTTLVARVVESELSRRVLWLTLSPTGQMAHLVSLMSLYLDQSGRASNLDDNSRIRFLLEQAERACLLVVIDSVDGLTDEEKKALADHSASIFRRSTLCLLSRAFARSPRIRKLELPGLSSDKLVALGVSFQRSLEADISESEMQELSYRAAGIPYVMMLLISLTVSSSLHDVLNDTAGLSSSEVSNYLVSAFARQFDREALLVLRIFARSLVPLPISVIESPLLANDVARAQFLKLREMGLLLRWDEGLFRIHDIVRDTVQSARLDAADCKLADRVLLAHYRQSKKDLLELMLQSWFLVSSCLDVSEISSAAGELCALFLAAGERNALHELAMNIIEKGGSDFLVHYSRGRAFRFAGKHRDAYGAYKEALAEASDSKIETAKMELASTLFEGGRYVFEEDEISEAKGFLTELMKSSDAEVRATAFLAQSHFVAPSSDPSQLSKDLENLLRDLPDGSPSKAHVTAFLGKALIEVPGRKQDGIDTLRHALMRAGTSAVGLGNFSLLVSRVIHWLVLAYFGEGSADASVKSFREDVVNVLGSSAHKATALQAVAQAGEHLYQQGLPDLAVAILDSVKVSSASLEDMVGVELFARIYRSYTETYTYSAWEIGRYHDSMEKLLEHHFVCEVFNWQPAPFLFVLTRADGSVPDAPVPVLRVPKQVGELDNPVEFLLPLAESVLNTRPELADAAPTWIANT